jgi:hypothetical protein
MRRLTEHQVNAANADLSIVVCDEAGSGGASHLYEISGYNSSTNPSIAGEPMGRTLVLFQNGGVRECGVNGITHEALLAILCDRLRAFQSSVKFACRENAMALSSLEDAQMWLNQRTRKRSQRGVEGTTAP